MIELPLDERMDVGCPIPAHHLAFIKLMDRKLSNELDNLRGGTQEADGQGKKQVTLSAAGFSRLGQL